jgi:ABC-type transport system substrate-binding protein
MGMVEGATRHGWRRFAAILIAGGLSATVLACGGGKATTSAVDSPSTGAVTTSGSQTTAAATTTPAPADATIGFSSQTQSLDPNKATYPTELAAIDLIGLNLTKNPSGQDPELSLASSLEPSSDGLTWTAKLRDGVTFSDGSPVTSADVQASFERVLKDKAAVGAGTVATIKSVDAPDPQTVLIHLKSKTPDLPILLSAQYLSVWPKAGLDQGKKFFDAPYSGGPYKLESWGGGPTLVLVANDSSFAGVPEIKKLTFATVDDPATRLAQVQSGQLQAATDIPANVLNQAKEPARAEFVPYFYGFAALTTRDTDPLMKDVRIRQAINSAIDRDQLNKIAFAGLVKPQSGFWPEGTPAYDASLPTQPDYDKAKALLKGTKCENGCKLTITFSTLYKDWGPQAAVIFRENLKHIGIDVAVDMVDPAVATKRYFDGSFQSRIGTSAAQVNTPSAILNPALKSDGGVDANFSGYKSAEMDALIDKAATLPADQQLPVLKQIGDLFEKDRPYIMLSNGGFFVVTSVPDDQMKFLSNFSLGIPLEQQGQ